MKVSHGRSIRIPLINNHASMHRGEAIERGQQCEAPVLMNSAAWQWHRSRAWWLWRTGGMGWDLEFFLLLLDGQGNRFSG